MSEIDSYRHKLLGYIQCPFEEGLCIPGKNEVPIYKLQETVESVDTFSARENDILVGGGSGEIPVLRISMPNAARFFSDDSWDEAGEASDLYQHFWTPEEAYILCSGFRKVGWNPSNQGIESWIAAHVISFLRASFKREFPGVFGADDIDEDGSICRLP